MYAHARREYPNECCGFVYGNKDAPTAGRAVACVNIQNELHAMDPKTHERDATIAYNLGAGDLFKLQKSLRTTEPVKVIYHSHIDVGAYFSPTDQAAAQMDGEPSYPVEYLRHRRAEGRCPRRRPILLERRRAELRRGGAISGGARLASADPDKPRHIG